MRRFICILASVILALTAYTTASARVHGTVHVGVRAPTVVVVPAQPRHYRHYPAYRNNHGFYHTHYHHHGRVGHVHRHYHGPNHNHHVRRY